MTALTPMERRVFDVLDGEFERPHVIAQRAKITTISPSETASKFCISLVRKGLAEKGGTSTFPRWRKKPEPQP